MFGIKRIDTQSIGGRRRGRIWINGETGEQPEYKELDFSSIPLNYSGQYYKLQNASPEYFAGYQAAPSPVFGNYYPSGSTEAQTVLYAFGRDHAKKYTVDDIILPTKLTGSISGNGQLWGNESITSNFYFVSSEYVNPSDTNPGMYPSFPFRIKGTWYTQDSYYTFTGLTGNTSYVYPAETAHNWYKTVIAETPFPDTSTFTGCVTKNTNTGSLYTYTMPTFENKEDDILSERVNGYQKMEQREYGTIYRGLSEDNILIAPVIRSYNVDQSLFRTLYITDGTGAFIENAADLVNYTPNANILAEFPPLLGGVRWAAPQTPTSYMQTVRYGYVFPFLSEHAYLNQWVNPEQSDPLARQSTDASLDILYPYNRNYYIDSNYMVKQWQAALQYHAKYLIPVSFVKSYLYRYIYNDGNQLSQINYGRFRLTAFKGYVSMFEY